jgi:predicted enzyme related to lactoylglutathione lyase
MGQTHHAAGTFCWAELATTDSEGAKKFYSSLMGWENHDDPIPGGGVYTMLLQQGGNVGALYEQMVEMKQAGIPPHWLAYVTVEDAAATAARAGELGGTVVKDAFDVFDIGTMAVLKDPTGAAFAIWQPKKHTGTDFSDARPGTMCWNELATSDSEKAGKFYSALFGWDPAPFEHSPTPYTIFKIGGCQAAGMLQMTEEWGDIPPNWMVYFSVADCDAAAQKAGNLGAEIKVPPTDIPPVGRFSVIQDPQGAVFSIIKLSDPSGS